MTNSPFLDDYCEDVDVDESQQQWLEVPKFHFWDGESDDEVLSDGVEAEAEAEKAAVEREAVESESAEATKTITTVRLIPTVTTWNTLTDINSTREPTVVPIYQCQDWETMVSEGFSPAFICSNMLKNWIQRFLFEIAHLRIRFYRSIVTAFRKATSWATSREKEE